MDSSQLNNDHTIGILSIPPGSTVLEIGTGNGRVASALHARGCQVWGIEKDKSAAEQAALYCMNIVAADIEEVDLHDVMQGQLFDAILMLDVIEHLRHPEDVLRKLRDFLRPSGLLIASIFNVAHAAVKLRLLEGHFEYTSDGPLHLDHLRFFDHKSIHTLFESSMLTIIDELTVTKGLEEVGYDLTLEKHSSEALSEVLADPDALTYQFVIFASPGLTDQLDEITEQISCETLSGALHRRLRSTEEVLAEEQIRLRRALDKIDELEKLLKATSDDLSEAIRQRAEALHVAELERRHLQADIAVKDEYILELRQRLAIRERLEEELVETQKRLAAQARIIEESAGYRAADRVNIALKKYPRLHWLTRSAARAIFKRSKF